MPNPANVSFSFYWFLVILMLNYIPGTASWFYFPVPDLDSALDSDSRFWFQTVPVPGFPKMYFYMFGQRKKVLGVEPAKKQK